MKKLLLLALALPTVLFAQDEQQTTVQNRYTVSANLNVSEPTLMGISIEYGGKTDGDGHLKRGLFNLSAATLTLEGEGIEVDGTGFAIEIGGRNYWEKGNASGFYTENFISYGSVKFDERVLDAYDFEGTYSYWSFINPNLGYKIMLGKNIALDPSIGFNWKWEVKGKGDVDNRYIDNLIWRAGIKLGYSW